MTVVVSVPTITSPRRDGSVVHIAEITLTSLLVQVGDQVHVGQPVAEIATDKVDLEVASTAGGVVTRLLAAPGDVVPVGGGLIEVTAAPDYVTPPPSPAAPQQSPPPPRGPVTIDDLLGGPDA